MPTDLLLVLFFRLLQPHLPHPLPDATARAERLYDGILESNPRIPYAQRICMMQRRTFAVDHALHAENAFGVPPGLLYMVAFLESHLGCDPRSGGCWGAPASRTERLRAGTPVHAARALRWSYNVCRERARRAGRVVASPWTEALSRFRCGYCTCPPPRPHLIPMPASGRCPSTAEPAFPLPEGTRATECLTDQHVGYRAEAAVERTRTLYRFVNLPLPTGL